MDKKTFLTVAMENVRAKKNADNSTEQIILTSDEVAAKRLIKKTGIAAVGVVGGLIALSYAIKRFEKNLPETTPEN